MNANDDYTISEAEIALLETLLVKYKSLIPRMDPVQANALQSRFIELADLCALAEVEDHGLADFWANPHNG